MITYTVIVTLFLLISLYVNWNLSKKVDILEKYASTFLTDLTTLREKIALADQIMTDADLKGAFASDDEVGSAFTIIKNAISELNEETTAEDTSELNGKTE